MTRDDELDLLAGDTQRVLADCVITVAARRPAGAYDAATRQRAVAPDAPVAPDVPAIAGDDEPDHEGDRRTRRRAWTVAAADLTFTPSKGGTVTQDGMVWSIARVQRAQDGRDWIITGERVD